MAYKTIKLYRTVNHNIRYYKFIIVKNLFNQFLVIREFGSIRNNGPTGTHKNYFNIEQDGVEFIKQCLKIKLKRGYKSIDRKRYGTKL